MSMILVKLLPLKDNVNGLQNAHVLYLLDHFMKSRPKFSLQIHKSRYFNPIVKIQISDHLFYPEYS